MVNWLALGVLCVGTTYWIWSHFWQNRSVERETDDDLLSIFESAIPQFSKKENGSYLEKMQSKEKQSFKGKKHSPKEDSFFQEMAVEETKFSFSPKKERTTPTILHQPAEKSSSSDQDPISLEEFEDFPEFDIIDFNELEVDDYLKELLGPSSSKSTPSLTGVSRSEISNSEKKDLCYEGMFTHFEGVDSSLQDCEKNKKATWIKFCNSSFVAHHLKTNERQSNWILQISIEPKQSRQAWQILSKELDATRLCFYGEICSFVPKQASQCECGKEIILHILKVDENRESDLEQFLSRLSYQFSLAGIHSDSRPLRGVSKMEREKDSVIPIQGKDSYFSYRAAEYIVISDEFWEEIAQEGIAVEGEKNIVFHADTQCSFIRENYYKTLSKEERINPLKFHNPFKNLTIKSLS
jgi:hypothetical protein